MSPKDVDKSAKRLRALMAEEDAADRDEGEEPTAHEKRHREMMELGFELLIGAARNLAVLAAGK